MSELEGLPRPTRRQLNGWRALHRARERRTSGEWLVEGARLVGELLASPLEVRALMVDESRADGEAVARALASRPSGVPLYRLTSQDAARLGQTVTPPPLLAVARAPRAPRLDEVVHPPPAGAQLLVLDGLADPGNAGTLLRAGLAFGVQCALLTEGSVALGNDKVLRSSAGAAFRLPCIEGAAASVVAEALVARAITVVVATPSGGEDAVAVADELRGGRWALWLGSEAHGSSLAGHRTVSIGMDARSESLNVSVAGGILLHRLAALSG